MGALTPVDQKPRWLDGVGAFLAVAVTLLVAFQTVAPYFIDIPTSAYAAIGQQQTMMQTVFIAVVSFFFGASLGAQQKDASIKTLAETASKAQETLSAATPTPDTTTTTTVTAVTTPPAPAAPVRPVPDADAVVEIEPGQTAIVSAKDKP